MMIKKFCFFFPNYEQIQNYLTSEIKLKLIFTNINKIFSIMWNILFIVSLATFLGEKKRKESLV